MHKSLLTGVSAAALLLTVATASAGGNDPMGADSGWYASLFGGASILQDFDNDYNYAGGKTGVDLETDVGFVVGVAAGKRIWESFRADVEIAYSNNNADGFDFDTGVAPYPADGDVDSLTVLANLWYDHDMGSGFTPYVGGGAGIGVVWGDYNQSVPAAPGKLVDGSDVGFAFQVGAGVNYALTEAIDLTVGYRFKGILDLSLNSTIAASGDKKGDLYSHSVIAGIVWKFTGPY